MKFNDCNLKMMNVYTPNFLNEPKILDLNYLNYQSHHDSF